MTVTKRKRKKKVNPFSFDFLSTVTNDTVANNQLNLFDSSCNQVVQAPLFDEISTASEEKKLNSLFDLFGDSTDTIKTKDKESKSYNFKITDYDLGKGSNREKFERNIKAIKLLKEIEADNRQATTEEQEILSRYVGWGGLSKCFDKGSNEDNKLKVLLNDKEYKYAKASMLSAYYTPPIVIEAIYKVLSSFGFTKGNILEPCCGVGNFLGMLPDSMSNSKVYGVELDSISGRIAQLLYPDMKIQIKGYEKVNFQDNFFDIAVGNIPFGNFGIADIRYEHMKLLIHDYFFVRTIDLVRPNGVIAFITSTGTLDKKNPKVREYIAKRCDFLGAIRLPNTTFKANAGTTVTSDIIFLKKRDSIIADTPLWTKSTPYKENTYINDYFIENKNMVIGDIELCSTPYGDVSITVNLPKDKDLKKELAVATNYIQTTDLSDICNSDNQNNVVLADDNIKNYSYTVINNEIYYRKNSVMENVELPIKSANRIKDMIDIRDLVNECLNIQMDKNMTDSSLKDIQEELNFKYDLFVQKYGRIADKANVRAFNKDVSLPLLKSLEIFDKNGNFERKADIFSKRTILPKQDIKHCETPVDALGTSLAVKGEVDFKYMSSLTNLTKNELIENLEGSIYPNPLKYDDNGEVTYEPADEYLSGNIRHKLAVAKKAAETNNLFCNNIRALEKVLPAPLDATEIDIKLGVVWLPKKFYNKFIYELLKVPNYMRKGDNEGTFIEVEYSKYNATFNIKNTWLHQHSLNSTVEYGTERRNAYQIIESCLNQRNVQVFDYHEDENGKKKAVLNEKETRLAQNKQEIIKSKFKDWIFENPDRRKEIVNLYNEKYNSIRPREYDGSYLTFSGMNPNISLYKYQKDAIARSLYGGNVLLAHCVGAGKTIEMIASIMEGKKLGKLTKALVVVPNHLTGQFGREFLNLYPKANIMVATESDFSKNKRRELVSKISTGNYDAIIIGHSQFLKIKLSDEHMYRYTDEEIQELKLALENCEDKSFSQRSIQRSLKSLETKLERIKSRLDHKVDDVLTFEQLGIDKLVIDEAHYFKNLQFVTKMNNVAGVNTSAADKASDLYYKCQYLNRLTNNKGLIFATGTPVSNNMTEIYTMQKYLQSEVLEEMDFKFFDAWAANFGEVVQSFELAPEGSGFRIKERFARFHNLPELVNIFKMVADIKTSEDVNLKLPKLKVTNISVDPTETQKEYVKDLSKRASAIHSGSVDSSVDNMLKITTDGRKCGLDQRMLNPFFPDEEGTKVNECVKNVFRIWKETEQKRLTQVVFCDFSTPSKDTNNGFSSVYDDMKTKLINLGVPENEIAFIHDYPKIEQKNRLFANVREGVVRILFGSTNKLGVGTNIQDKLIATHDLDIPWRPSDLEQRLGRMLRQGNINKEVYLYRYTTKGTFDAYLFQILENKQRFISQIMTSKNPVRSCENVDEATLNFAEVKALCTGNPKIKEKLELDNEVSKLKLLKTSFQSTKYKLQNAVNNTLPGEIAKYRNFIKMVNADINSLNEDYIHLNSNANKEFEKAFEIKIKGITYNKRIDAAEALRKALSISYSQLKEFDDNEIGEYAGLHISVIYDSVYNIYRCRLKGYHNYYFELGNSALGSIRRIENGVISIPERLKFYENKLKYAETQYNETVKKLNNTLKFFPQQKELEEKEERLRQLNYELSLDD